MCVACGTDSSIDYFCQPCWKSTPLPLKQAWWHLTQGNRHAPTDEEIAEFIEKRRGAND